MSAIIDEIDDFWEDFLPFVEEGRVIPIIGPDLILLEDDQGVEHRLLDLLAKQLAKRLRLDMQGHDSFDLNDVVTQFLQARGRREDIYPKIRASMRDLALKPSAVLRELASIRDFTLYLSLTFDALLVDAINAERCPQQACTEHLGYAPNKIIDLPTERALLQHPVVYALFGKLSIAPEYVITEEDMLEFLYALQSDSKRPHLLFDELQSSHLLFLGCTYPDWLTRFLIRITKSRQLSQQRNESELIVGDQICQQQPLVLFLENFSYATRLISQDPVAFVHELARRWCARNPPNNGGQGNAAAHAEAPLEDDFPTGGIFLSYAKEDVEVVSRISDALAALGLDVWFDKERLEAGDGYDHKIKRNIKTCSLFIPIISATTQNRREGYFRREWKLAEERSFGIADTVAFILPVVIDDVDAYNGLVPESFQRAQWTSLPSGELSPEFELRLVKLVREYRKHEKGLA